MPTYSYRCTGCGAEMTLRHSMTDTDRAHTCPTCGKPLRRVLEPVHHWWPSNHRPGNEASGQRVFLDPERQARMKDRLARELDARAAARGNK